MSSPLHDLRFLMFVDDVYEDLELWYPKLRLEEAGAHVTIAGPQANRTYAGKHGYPCKSDAAISEMEAADFHGLIIPGGFMPDKLRRDEKVKRLVREFAEAEKLRIRGKAITPYLLAKIEQLTGGRSLETNIELVLNNARLGGAVAVALNAP